MGWQHGIRIFGAGNKQERRVMVLGNLDEGKSYECVEPDVGEQLWQYNMPGVDSELQQHLEDHLTVCAECRLQLALQRHMEDQEPAKVGRVLGRRNWITGSVSISAGLSLAACLLLMFFLPPKSPNASMVLRSDGNGPSILRPVSGEVVPGTNFHFTWTAVKNASGYRLQVRDPAGSFEWMTETQQTSTELPADIKLPANKHLHAYLEIIPPYLTPDEGIDVSFQTGSAVAYFGYRLRITPLWVWALGALGFVLAGWRGKIGSHT